MNKVSQPRVALSAISDWAKNNYFPDSSVEAEHIRSLTNDVYMVTRSEDHYVLKIYGDAWRSKSAIEWEVALLDYLDSRDVGVAKAVAGIDGKKVQTIHVEEVLRYAVLCEYAKGGKPKEPFTPDLYYREGRAVAAMHSAGDDFSSTNDRHVLNLEYLLDKPISDASAFAKQPDREFLEGFGSYLHGRIDPAVKKGMDWGPVHGDMTLDNFHEAADGKIYFYDFDSGGMGWRASDIQGWAIEEKNNEKRQAFLKGYREIRELSDIDENVSPYIFAAWEVWGLSSDFTNRIAKDGEQAILEYLSDQTSRLRSLDLKLKLWETKHTPTEQAPWLSLRALASVGTA